MPLWRPGEPYMRGAPVARTIAGVSSEYRERPGPPPRAGPSPTAATSLLHRWRM